MDAATAHREWFVGAKFVGPGEPGMAIVRVTLVNGRAGSVPPLDVAIDWKPGMEPRDLEVFALAIVADAGDGLSRACVAEAAKRSAS